MKLNKSITLSIVVFIYAVFPAFAETADVKSSDVPWLHGIAMHGDMKYPANFTHLNYVNPDAPRGGVVRRASVSSGFDSFNAFIPKGNSASGLTGIYDSLMVGSGDEAFTQYGQLAEFIQVPEDRSWVAYRLRENAKWHDGQPVTPEDVVWTFNTLMEKGRPSYKYYYGDVINVEKIGPRDVKFSFKSGDNRELPLIIGQLNILPKHYWQGRDFERTTLEPPLGSGPYKISKFEANRFIVYERVKDYWGAGVPVNKGKFNFDQIRYDYYSDGTIALEALKAGEYDLRVENSAKNWAAGYDTPAVKKGELVKSEFIDNTAHGLQGFILNQRRDKFKDPQVRQALGAAFDFEWSNQTYFYGQYRRARSFFNASELEAKGLPDARELEILNPFRDQLPQEVFYKEYNPPSTNKDHGIRTNLLWAAGLLRDAGWVVNPDNLKLTNQSTGEIFTMEFMVQSPAMQRVVLPMIRNFKRLGIDASVRLVDSSQYVERFRKRDYDTMVMNYGQSMSPGNEQRGYWGTAAADDPGSYNISGLKNPVVDALIEQLIEANTREELIYRTRALDRVLQWLHIAIPQFYGPVNRVAYWNRFGIPAEKPTRGIDFDAWWIEDSLDAKLKLRRGSSTNQQGNS